MISNINNNQPAFKQLSIVQIPRKAFRCPNNYSASLREFTSFLNTNAMQKPVKRNFWGRIPKVDKKYDLFLEQPGYTFIRDELKQAGNYSLEWLNLHTGIETPKPMREDYHSFVVFSGEEHSVIKQILSPLNKEKYTQRVLGEFEQQKSKGKNPDFLWFAVRLNELITSVYNRVASMYKPVKYEVENFEELKKFVPEITK